MFWMVSGDLVVMVWVVLWIVVIMILMVGFGVNVLVEVKMWLSRLSFLVLVVFMLCLV